MRLHRFCIKAQSMILSNFCRQTADLFAEAGYLVIIPDFYRGTWKDPTSPDVVEFAKEQTQWSKLKLDLENIILPFAKSKGSWID